MLKKDPFPGLAKPPFHRAKQGGGLGFMVQGIGFRV